MNDNEKKLSEITNPALVDAMVRMKEEQSREAELNFMTEIRKSRLISPAIVETKDENGEYHIADGSKSEPEDTRIHFMMLSQSDGKKFMPAFTDMAELRKWREEEKLQTVVTTFEHHIEMILKDEDGPSGFVINPFGENIIMSRELLQKLKEAAEKQKDEKVMIGELSEYPDELIKTMTDFFDEKGTVEKAYLQMIKRGDVINYLLVIDFDNSEDTVCRRELFDAVAATVKDYLKDLGLSIAAFTDPFGKQVTENRLPFYTR